MNTTRRAGTTVVPTVLPRLGIRLYGGLPPAHCVSLASAAEQAGFKSVWFAENPLERGVLPALAACAVATRRIELGIGVWNPFTKHPAQIAMEIGALDELSGGRTVLGLGAGLAAPLQRLGIDTGRPLAALRDTFHIVRGLLRGESITYTGRVFSVEGVKLSYTPPRPGLPLLMAGRGPRTLRLCGEIADGLMVSNMCPPGFARHALSIVQPAPRRVVQYASCSIAADRTMALAAIKPVIAGMLKTFWALGQRVPAAQASLVDHSGIPGGDFAATVARLEAGQSPLSAIDQRFVDAFAVAGTPGDCSARIAAYGAAGVTDLGLTFVGADPLSDIVALGSAMVPA
jgi:5,10-methylenetetrahydromethanopterin reductase